jgi:hypothetical protein
MAATIAANLLGDRNLWSAILFALCNAGEAVLTAWLIEHCLGSDFRLSKLRNVVGLAAAAIIGATVSGIGGRSHSNCFTARRHQYERLGNTGSRRTDLESSRLHRAGRACLSLAHPAVAERTRQRRVGGRGAGAGKWTCDFPLVGALGECWSGCCVIRAAVVARGALPAGFRSGSRVHRQRFNRLDNHLWHWLFR